MDCLEAESRRPKTVQPIFDPHEAEQLRAILHQSPRAFGKPTSVWTLALAGEVCHQQGLIERPVSIELIRQGLQRLGVGWQRAKHWDHFTRLRVRSQKKRRDLLIARVTERNGQGWVVGYGDEVWWSRLAQPRMHAWTEAGQPLRLQQFDSDAHDPDPKALCCYGLLREDTEQMWLRFVDGRSVSHVTTAYLEWACECLAAEGKRVLVLIWDNASWHVGREVRNWLRDHNRRALADRREGKVDGGVQIVPCWLPTKSPWLNDIEPKWVHGKRAVVEPDRKLAPGELTDRICAYFHCDHVEHLKQNVS